jgi:hypothetical protein
MPGLLGELALRRSSGDGDSEANREEAGDDGGATKAKTG